MTNIILKLALNVFTLLIVSYLVPGFKFSNLWATVVTAVVIGVVNTFIKPVLHILFLTTPMKTFIKSKSSPNTVGPGYRTPDHFKGSVFSGGKINPKMKAQKF